MPGSFDNFTIPVTNLVEEDSHLDAPPIDAPSAASSISVPKPYKTLYSPDGQQHTDGTITTDYVATVSYDRINGQYVYPVAGTDTSGSQAGVVVQEHCPVETALITWVAVATGAPPRIPSPQLADPNFVCVRRAVGLPTPVLGIGGAIRRWMISGTYLYQMKVPGAMIRNFPGLGNVLDLTPRAQNALPASKFDSSLVF